MNEKTILYAVAAFAAAGVLYLMGRRSSTPQAQTTGDESRMAGTASLLAMDQRNTAMTDQAVAQNWAALSGLWAKQPDWYI